MIFGVVLLMAAGFYAWLILRHAHGQELAEELLATRIELVRLADTHLAFRASPPDQSFGPAADACQDAACSPARRSVRVGTERELADALLNARAGDDILLADGDYRFDGPSLPTRGAGTKDAPILVRADRLGSARLRLATVEGFTIRAPYWEFRNLDIEGVCAVEDECEHAFHVAGGGAHAAIRNNRLRNFNAAIKINTEGGVAPDDVRVERNLIFNDGLRSGRTPVTMVDVVGADRVRIARNIIADFAKSGGNRVSYGAFAKGGGTGALIENNLVLCSWRHYGRQRVGLSLGGGGTGPGLCRDGTCSFEQRVSRPRARVLAAW